MKKALRWKMALLITAAIAISYFDRQTLPIAIRAIQREIPVTNTQFSHLQAAVFRTVISQGTTWWTVKVALGEPTTSICFPTNLQPALSLYVTRIR